MELMRVEKCPFCHCVLPECEEFTTEEELLICDCEQEHEI